MRHSTYSWVLLSLLCASLVHGEDFSLLFQNADEVLTYGEARISNASTLLLATIDSETSGIALYPSQVTAYLGFTTQFLWTTTSCNDMISLAPSNYSDGFFMTPNSLNPTELESSQSLLGIGKFSSLFAVAYVSTYNEFYVCEWYGEAPVDYDTSLFRSKCRVFPNPSDRYTCGSYQFRIDYDYFNSRLTVSVNDVDKFVASTKVPATRYYVGLSAGNDVYARQQEISAWTWHSKQLVDRFVQQEADFPYLFSSVQVQPGIIRIGQSAVTNTGLDKHGAAFYEHFVVPHNYFNVKFSYSISKCGTQNYGGLGFGMVFMKRAQLTVPMNGLQLLGAFYQPNATVIGYYHTSNAFFICRTGPEGSSCPAIPSPLPQLPCNRAHQFEVMYEDGIAQIYVNGKFAAAGKLEFDSAAYVIGMTGSAVRQALGVQSFGSWVYDATRSPIVTTKFDFNGAANTSLLSFYRNATLSGNKIALTTQLDSDGHLGVVLFNQPFSAHLGFKARIKFTTDPEPVCDPASRESDTVFTTMFITTDYPSAEQLHNATYTDLGLQQARNVHLFTFDWSQRSLRYCNGVTGDCYSTSQLYSGLLSRCEAVSKIFDVIFTGRQLILTQVAQMNSEFEVPTDQSPTVINVPLSIAQGVYYAGIVGYNNRQALAITDWTFERHQAQRTAQFNLSFDTMASHFSFIGNTSLVNNKLQIAEAGLVVHNTPFYAHKGFSTEFTWAPNCNSEQVPKPQGFSLFLSQARPPLDLPFKSNALTGQFGTATLPNVVSISYNRVEDTFYAYFGTSSGVTFNALNNGAPIACNTTHRFRIEFAVRNTVAIYVDDVLYAVLGDEVASIIERAYYYVGLAGEGLQLFDDWQYTAVVPQTLVLEYGFDNHTHLEMFGTAALTQDTLRLTTGGSESGAVMYPVPIYAHTGFNSSITWTPTNCDAANNGADGFTLFLTKNLPLYEQVYNSAGGLLGIGNVPNVVMFAYSATFNEFYVCEWTTPLIERFGYGCDVVKGVIGPKYTCPDTHVFEFGYNHQVLEIRANGVLHLTAAVNLEPVQYYVGISGATGGGYFQQDISRWYFESIVL